MNEPKHKHRPASVTELVADVGRYKLARMVRCSLRTVQRWEFERRIPPTAAIIVERRTKGRYRAAELAE